MGGTPPGSVGYCGGCNTDADCEGQAYCVEDNADQHVCMYNCSGSPAECDSDTSACTGTQDIDGHTNVNVCFPLPSGVCP
jgi:hypothetical protein